ncbi:uncharacterized protein [Solanum tuberosum]|uniref:Virus-specific-signaling-pathway regulated protein n=1 Tax=Solanum tuberosum TaxID=4113 RepID=M1AAE1_SOLTU|nr:PREDICTED: uncharacterized protein LOC102584507 [Solanum tuberosum]
MAYLASENLVENDSAFLMSFLDEPLMEYCNDEKLNFLIQSLEAELEYPNIKGDCIFDDDNVQNLNFIDNSSLNFYHCEDNVYIRSAPEDGEDSSEELVDVDGFSWMDTEMSSLTSPSNDNMIEFQNFITCIPIEDEVYDSLWLQTDLSMVDNISQ